MVTKAKRFPVELSKHELKMFIQMIETYVEGNWRVYDLRALERVLERLKNRLNKIPKEKVKDNE